MSETSTDIARLLERELRGFAREIALFPDEASVWRTLPGVTNSAGQLARHVAGNLQYFVGTVLGGTGFTRDRDAEFGPAPSTRAEVAAGLEAAIAVVTQVLPPMSDEALAADFPEPVMGVAFRTRAFLLHLVAHAAFHLGQAGYLRRAATGDGRSSGPIPLAPLARQL
jgi:uncharacterized damage-inducible protein DinB